MHMDSSPRHRCVIYEGSPAMYIRGLGMVFLEKMNQNTRCLYLNRPEMVARMRSYLASAGLDVVRATREGKLVLTSDRSHLVKGSFDPARMLDMLEETVEQALDDGFEALLASGDMTFEFGDAQDFDQLMEYEWGLEELFQRQPALQGICQYDVNTLPHQAVEHGLYTHHSVFISETLCRTNPF